MKKEKKWRKKKWEKSCFDSMNMFHKLELCNLKETFSVVNDRSVNDTLQIDLFVWSKHVFFAYVVCVHVQS